MFEIGDRVIVKNTNEVGTIKNITGSNIVSYHVVLDGLEMWTYYFLTDQIQKIS